MPRRSLGGGGCARVAKLADATDLRSVAARHVGSTPTPGTKRMLNKLEQLKALEAEIRADVSLPLAEANLVFGEGNPETQVLFVGEAPGFHEDQLGRPFVGRAGKLLDQLIAELGWRREMVYITNIVKRRPPENRDPLPTEISAYQPYLVRQIAIINPSLVAPLGRFAMNHFLPFAKISRDQGKIFRSEGRLIYPLYHPAAALRATAVLDELKHAFARLPEILAGRLTPTPPVNPSPSIVVTKEKLPAQSSLF